MLVDPNIKSVKHNEYQFGSDYVYAAAMDKYQSVVVVGGSFEQLVGYFLESQRQVKSAEKYTCDSVSFDCENRVWALVREHQNGLVVFNQDLDELRVFKGNYIENLKETEGIMSQLNMTVDREMVYYYQIGQLVVIRCRDQSVVSKIEID